VFVIPEQAYEIRFTNASGPGGQHVNKASTAVELKVYVRRLGLPPGALARLESQQRNRINRDGALIVQADQFRSQLKNRKAALSRVQGFIEQALVRPKRRVATRPSLAAKQKRIRHKKARSQVKANRRRPTPG